MAQRHKMRSTLSGNGRPKGLNTNLGCVETLGPPVPGEAGRTVEREGISKADVTLLED